MKKNKINRIARRASVEKINNADEIREGKKNASGATGIYTDSRRDELIGGLDCISCYRIVTRREMTFSRKPKKKKYFSLDSSRSSPRSLPKAKAGRIGFVRSESGQTRHTIRSTRRTMACNNSGRVWYDRRALGRVD